MFPRLQHRGVEFRYVERDAVRAGQNFAMLRDMVTTGLSISSQSHM